MSFLPSSFAKVSLPKIICDDMILQQNSKNAIWGFAKPQESITLTSSWGEKISTQASNSGDWKIMLKTPAYGTGFSITIKGENEITLKNIAIGEVWLCMGQSNMGFSLGTTFHTDEDSAKANYPNLRIFKSEREHWHVPQKTSRDRLAKWKPCTPEVARKTSAVSFYFAQKLHLELGIPVGIIQKAYAGTPIEGWMPYNIQKNDERTQKEVEIANAKVKPGMYEESLKKYTLDLAEYHKKIDTGNHLLTATRNISPPFFLRPATLGHQYPGNIYNGMIAPIVPYGIKGIVWYQGERNSKYAPQAEHYQNQLPKLINFYRNLWHTESEGATPKNMPFQFTQLPSWHTAQTTPVEGPEAIWAINREMMRLVAKEVENTHMATSIDTGDAIDLHPRNKKPIGIRHAYLALKNTYQKNIIANGPTYVSQTINNKKIVVHFKHIGGGLTSATGAKLNSFAIAGEDRVWKWADAKIKNNTISLSHHDIANPVAVRYAWAMNPSERNLLYNTEGLPASPFRTDSWPLYEASDVEVLVHKPKAPKGYALKDWKRPTMVQ